MPVLQLGTAQLIHQRGIDPSVHDSFVGMLPERGYRQLETALRYGIRAFDSAYIYRSQTSMAYVLADWWRHGKIDRSDVWITTKIFHPNATSSTFGSTHMPTLSEMDASTVSKTTMEHFEASLMQLGVGYVDLVLLHWPSGWNEGTSDDNRQRRLAAWQVLEHVYDKGWTRAIGVSNFSPTHLEQLKHDGARIVPMVNQFEASVSLQYDNIRSYCLQHNIVPQAYSPFGRGVLSQPEELDAIAEKYGKDSGQVAIRYLTMLGYSVVYLSNSKRMLSNTNIFDFELTEQEMELLRSLNRPDGGWGLPSPNELQ